MKRLLQASAIVLFVASVYAKNITVNDPNLKVKYTGFERNAVEVFLNIKYGEDTGGQRRFKPPKPFKPQLHSTIDAMVLGPACPQELGELAQPLALNNVTVISEDCLNLNLARQIGTCATDRLPVMIWIHGGSFWFGSNTDLIYQPDALIQESVKNGLPVIHVTINYRLGLFGFAQSAALKKEGSENAGLRDQRLAIEWVRDNIVSFGGDPKNITIFGQSSGGLAVGMQLLAYGGTKPLSFQRGICQSQALEAGITGNFSIDAMTDVVNYLGCNTTSVHSPETIACLRNGDMQDLFDASLATHFSDIEHNIGDIWLPSVDGDFIPAPPSQLVKEGRFGNATMMMGWTENDVTFFTDYSIATPNDTEKFISGYLSAMPQDLVSELLDLYPVEEFAPPQGTNLTAEFYRSARIFRDIIVVCQPLFLAEAIHNKSKSTYQYGYDSSPADLKKVETQKAYLYTFNQTILEPILTSLLNISHFGAIHTSELAYVYANLSHWNVNDWPWGPKPSDYELVKRASRSWSSFAAIGNPSLDGKETLRGWEDAYAGIHGNDGNVSLYVVGGPHEGFTAIDGEAAVQVVKEQRLKARCGLINSERFIEGLQY